MSNRNRVKLAMKKDLIRYLNVGSILKFVVDEHTLKYLSNVQQISIEKIYFSACTYGNLNVVKLLMQQHIDVFNNINVFVSVCEHGYLDIAKYLIQLGINISIPVNIYKYNDRAFILACCNGQLDIAKYLMQLWFEDEEKQIDIHVRIKKPFMWACHNKHLDMVKYLESLCPNNYSFSILNNSTIHPIVH